MWLEAKCEDALAFGDLTEEELAENVENEQSGRELEECSIAAAMRREGFRRKGVVIGWKAVER